MHLRDCDFQTGPLAVATSRLQRGREQSEKPTTGLLSGSHFHIAGVAWGLDVCMQVRVYSCPPVRVSKRRKERKKREGREEGGKGGFCLIIS